MVEKDRIGFIGVPGSAIPAARPDSLAVLFDRLSRHLPPPCQAVVVSGTRGLRPALQAEGVVYLPLLDRWDRYMLKSLARLQAPLSLFSLDYHFRSYFHQVYVKRAAALLADHGVHSIVFPLYPQWAPRIRALAPHARLILWMPSEWLSAGPSFYGNYLEGIDRIVCGSRYIAQKVMDRYPESGDRLLVLPCGADTRFFTSSPVRCRHQILYAGRLSPERGAHLLLEAFERIRLRYPDAHLVLAGPVRVTPPSHLVGSPAKDIRTWRRLGRGYERMIRRKAWRLKSVFLTGRVNPSSLARIYRTASVFVRPSLWNEPFGMVLAEAMASGLPVVASRCGGIPELVEDGRSGILVEPGSVDELVGAIERFFENRDAAMRFGQAARARAEELFDWKRIASLLVEAAMDA